ncbi:MAG: SLC13 family permease, partial [Candidatus Poseidoniaceae archaeon]
AIMVGLLILIGVYALIVTEVVHRTLAAALGGLIAVGALQYYTGESLSLAMVTTMIDWETIGLLLGMMIMVGVLSHTGVFEYFAVEAYKR